MKVGVMVPLVDHMEQEFGRVRDLGIATCQLVSWQRERFTAGTARGVKEIASQYGITITAFWCGWEGPAVWNFYDGPLTLGLVPPVYQHKRMETLLAASDFARELAVEDIVTHVGFIPENPNDPDYASVVQAIKFIARRYQDNGQFFLFETGQETPVTLLRTMQDIGLDNLGINLDPANLLLYGKANPVDSLDVFGKYVRGVHAKDGEYPTDGHSLGEEKPLGQGRVNFPALVAKLKELNYTGALTIEREIRGEQQLTDIRMAKELLEELLACAAG